MKRKLMFGDCLERMKKKRHDYDGFIKLVQDACFDVMGYDDSLITDAAIKKRFDGDYIKIKVWGG